MKKILSIAVLFFMAFGTHAQKDLKNALKLNPLSLLVKTGNISYERALSDRLSVQLGGFYSLAGIKDFRYGGQGLVPEVRFYFGGQAKPLNGAYVAPYGRYQNFAIRNEELKTEAKVTTIGGGVVAGYQKSWDSRFILNLFVGPSFNRLSFKDENGEDGFDLHSGMKGFGLRTGLTIGFSF